MEGHNLRLAVRAMAVALELDELLEELEIWFDLEPLKEALRSGADRFEIKQSANLCAKGVNSNSA